jgi:hypothetical protein
MITRSSKEYVMEAHTPEETTYSVDTIAERLKHIVDEAAQQLKSLDESTAAAKPAPDKWSIKEIIGHLIDSATNNHQRFIRAQDADPLIFPRYYQDMWVNAQGYNDTSWQELVELWRLYNHHLAHVIRRVPQEKLEVECRIGEFEPATLGFIIADYLDHLNHHLHQIAGRQA